MPFAPCAPFLYYIETFKDGKTMIFVVPFEFSNQFWTMEEENTIPNPRLLPKLVAGRIWVESMFWQ